MSKTVNLPRQLRAASIVPATVNADARTADVVWTTGAQVRRFSFLEGPFLEELKVTRGAVRMDRLNNGAPLLDSHQSWSLEGVIGVVESAEIKDGEGRATVRFAGEDERAEAVFRKVLQGIIRNVSVGYIVHAYKEIKRGADRVLQAVDWEPLEISLVPVGADAGAGVRADDGDAIPCTIERASDGGETTDEDDGMSDKNKVGSETPGGEDTRNQPGNQPAQPPAPAAVDEAAIRAEERAKATAEAKAIVETVALVNGSARDAAKYIAEGKTPDEVRGLIMEQRANGQGSETRGAHQPGGDSLPADALKSRMQQRFKKGN